jgi:uncharacterized membrane protein YbhN (UPF0104 family)
MAAGPLTTPLALGAPSRSGSPGALASHAAGPVALVVAVAAAVLVARGPLDAFTDALRHAVAADPRWMLGALAFEALSFAGYAALLWHVAERGGSRLGPAASLQVSLAGAAATRLLPTAGMGGAALTLWTLQRAGQPGRAGVRALLTFLVLLYAVFLGAIAVAGGLVACGVGGAEGPVALALGPAALAGAAIAVAAWLAWGRSSALAEAPVPGAGADRRLRLRAGLALLPAAVRDAGALLRRPDPRLLGALAWWAFDIAVLWCTFQALGVVPPVAVLVLAYLLGQVANTLPLPGSVSGGTVGVLIAFGVASAPALAAVLAYRAIAVWVPGTAGTAALAGLRGTVARWAV